MRPPPCRNAFVTSSEVTNRASAHTMSSRVPSLPGTNCAWSSASTCSRAAAGLVGRPTTRTFASSSLTLPSPPICCNVSCRPHLPANPGLTQIGSRSGNTTPVQLVRQRGRRCRCFPGIGRIGAVLPLCFPAFRPSLALCAHTSCARDSSFGARRAARRGGWRDTAGDAGEDLSAHGGPATRPRLRARQVQERRAPADALPTRAGGRADCTSAVAVGGRRRGFEFRGVSRRGFCCISSEGNARCAYLRWITPVRCFFLLRRARLGRSRRTMSPSLVSRRSSVTQPGPRRTPLSVLVPVGA